ncbi:unnamed protein product, partial [Rotaria sp. Silwood1]
MKYELVFCGFSFLPYFMFLSFYVDHVVYNIKVLSTNSRKTYVKTTKQIPIAKRLRFTTDHDGEKDEDQQTDLQQILNHIKQVNVNLLKLQKQQEHVVVMILDRYKIPVVLENDNENANVKGTDSTDSEL